MNRRTGSRENGSQVSTPVVDYGWNSVRKFGRLRGTYDALRATQSTGSIAFATLIDIELCDTNLIHSFLMLLEFFLVQVLKPV